MPQVLILSYHFYPSPAVGAKRVSELACRLRDEGWKVTVVTAPSEAVREFVDRTRGMEVHIISPPVKLYPLLAHLLKRLWPEKSDKAHSGPRVEREDRVMNSSAKKWWPFRHEDRRESLVAWLKRNYHALELVVDDRKLWSFQVFLRALRIGTHFDWIISSGPPASVHVAARLVSGLRRSPWIMDLRDPWVCNHFWPDQAKSASSLRDKVERFLERKCIQGADSVTVASPGIGKALQKRVPAAKGKLHVVLNGYDVRTEPSTRPSGRLRLLYAGSLYLNRNPFVLLEALRDLVSLPSVDRRRVSFTLVGRCESWNGRHVSAWLDATGMHDIVHVLPSVSQTRVAALMEEAEVLVNFAQGQPEQIPAKLYDYIASGREMLLVAETDSDAARITLESGAGRIVEPEDLAGMRAVLAELYSFYVERGLPYETSRESVARFSREYQNRRFMDLLTVSLVRS